MIRAQSELSTLKIEMKMSTHRSSSQHFPTCSTVLMLRLPETPAGESDIDHHLPVHLDLINPFGATGNYSRHAYRARLVTLVDIYCIIQ